MRKKVLFIMCVWVLGMSLCAQAKVDPNLVGWWRLDDGAGITAIDSSGHGNDGEFVGNPQWVSGIIGPALYLDGDSWVEIPHSDILTVDNEVTVAAWVKADQLDDDGSGYAGIICKSNGPRSYSLYTTGNGTLHFSVNGTGGTSTTALVIGEWTHLAAMVKGGTKYYFFNGVPDPAGVSGVTLPGLADTATVLIGNSHEDLEREFHGIIDDVRIYNRGLEEAELAQVMKGSPPELAENPSPEDESSDALRDGMLTWKSGKYESTHNVYFGTTLEDVDAATVPTATGLTVNSFDPGRLEFGQTYFWRIDEVNVTPDRTVHKGDVWSFTVEPYAVMIPVAADKVTASSSADENPASMIVNGSGLEGNTHSNDSDDMWLSAMPDMAPSLTFEFDQAQKLDQMKIWNSNSESEAFVGWGIKDVTIETS
ncbi:MAG: LamG domain-containing protein, partial [Phycisphaerae bacterium]|nr:LamG domain-containing protein [Phycisphaerae bacterium]